MGARGRPYTAALVLGSGGARGAYEVGVAHFLYETAPAGAGGAAPFTVFAGTSAGAINACALAAFADQPGEALAFLRRRWTDLRLAEVIRPDRGELVRLIRLLAGRPAGRWLLGRSRGGLLDPGPFRRLLLGSIPFGRIDQQLAAGRIRALGLGATDARSGRAVLFVRSGVGTPRPLPGTLILDQAALGAEHALASAAIPILLPPVTISGRLYCDGSLRQSVPLGPAHHLGADRLVAVSTQHCAALDGPNGDGTPSPLWALGKAINALTLDRLEDDLDRLERTNQIIDAGRRAFGEGFVATLSGALDGRAGPALTRARVAVVRPSVSLGQLAAEHVRSRTFARRADRRVCELLGRLGEQETEHEADLLSYLLFDGPFADELMALGYADARRQGDELVRLFAGDEPEPEALAAAT